HSFSPEFVTQLLQKYFSDSDRIKINTNDSTAKLCADLLTVFVCEAATRAANQAGNEDSTICEVEHLEKILPQLLLDF
uniref:Centromere protein X n=1 Tax=Ciona savignyi TaxID=51511 RepID=H2ZDL5_CIOSA